MFFPSRVRGGTFVDYLVLVALALALLGGAFLVYRSAFGAGARCLASKIVGSGGQCEGGGGPKEQAEVTALTPIPGAIDARCDSSGKCTNGACFGAGTKVLTPNGDRPIETIVAGDRVFAKDVETGAVSARTVLATKVTYDKPSLRLELSRGDVIVVTAEHPFYVAGRGWTAAAALEPDDRVTTADGAEAKVVSLAMRAAIEPVFNLEVEEDHTYFVGSTKALVHNDCDITQAGWTRPWRQYEADQVIKAAQQSAEALARLMSPNQGPSMHSPGFDVEGARRRDMAAVSARSSTLDATMAQILLSPTSDPGAKRAVAQAIASGTVGQGIMFPMPPPGLLHNSMMIPSLMGRGSEKAFQEMQDRAFATNALRIAFARYAAAQGTPEMKQKAAQVLASGATTFDANRTFEVFGKKLQYVLQKAQKAEDGDPMKRLGQLLYAQELAKDPKWADKVDKDLLKLFLERQYKEPTVAAELARMHKETLDDIKYSDSYRAHLAMLEGEEFLLRLQLEGPEQAKKTLETEIGKVAAIDAAMARDILDRIVGRQVMADFFALDEDTQAAALERSIDVHLAELAKKDSTIKDFTKTGIKAPADVLKRIAKVLKEQQAALAANRTAEASAQIDKITSDAAKAGQITPAQQTLLKKVFTGLEHADKYGHVSSVAALAGLFALGLDVKDGEAFKNVDKSLSSGATLLKTVNSLESYAKLGLYLRSGAAAKLATTGRLATAIKLAKWAGPIADGISVYLDGKSSYDNFKKGHLKEAYCDAGAAGCATVSVIAGIAIASGATGPAAPIALLVGTVGYLSFKGIKWMVADPDEIKALREAGVLRDTSGQALAAIHAREIRKYAGSCTSDRRNCPGPIGEEARRILDGEKRMPLTFDPFPPGSPKNDTVRERLWRMEAEVIRDRGAKFYKDHGAAPGTCGSCH